jgi:opacity protein-like surface antigen
VLKSVLIGTVLAATLAGPVFAAGGQDVPAQIGASQPIDGNIMQLMSAQGASNSGTLDVNMVQPAVQVSDTSTSEAPPMPEERPAKVRVEQAAVITRTPAPRPMRTASVAPQRMVIQLDGLWMIGAFR